MYILWFISEIVQRLSLNDNLLVLYAIHTNPCLVFEFHIFPVIRLRALGMNESHQWIVQYSYLSDKLRLTIVSIDKKAFSKKKKKKGMKINYYSLFVEIINSFWCYFCSTKRNKRFESCWMSIDLHFKSILVFISYTSV